MEQPKQVEVGNINIAKNREEFVRMWTEHIRVLNGLWNTATAEQMKKVVVIIHELEDLVKEISGELAK